MEHQGWKKSCRAVGRRENNFTLESSRNFSEFYEFPEILMGASTGKGFLGKDMTASHLLIFFFKELMFQNFELPSKF